MTLAASESPIYRLLMGYLSLPAGFNAMPTASSSTLSPIGRFGFGFCTITTALFAMDWFQSYFGFSY